ncbi:JAB domain-containing protein [Weissella paramesenteroides]|uniref:JAB domain-containing protein n=1 Tax=Weissella paramesenteroides TaxID=1249 RepID=UPI00103F2AC0|nr:JAB domain-containing protein [Weissella paramesenteroides]RZQ57827.1 DNA repair protein RadC [Weissella paramesenteroides]
MTIKIISVRQLGDLLMQRYAHSPQEGCWVVAVTTQMTIIEIYQVALGTLDSVNIHPRDVFRHLVATNAYGFILCHNHPSGNLNASPADKSAMSQMAMCSQIMQVHFLDFMIISTKGYRSYRTEHLLPKVELETLIDLWTKVDNM